MIVLALLAIWFFFWSIYRPPHNFALFILGSGISPIWDFISVDQHFSRITVREVRGPWHLPTLSMFPLNFYLLWFSDVLQKEKYSLLWFHYLVEYFLFEEIQSTIMVIGQFYSIFSTRDCLHVSAMPWHLLILTPVGVIQQRTYP